MVIYGVLFGGMHPEAVCQKLMNNEKKITKLDWVMKGKEGNFLFNDALNTRLGNVFFCCCFYFFVLFWGFYDWVMMSV